ncbi:hypothetical protein F53441_5322 [Fusarium austroafricanum]|uniref:Major facilitator superfamily (MFS) profile domain-containing protein n=1 Tax=Fusarium austroafricanum TaxID=2364996 RepID=A0A8H4KL02_9HYPO|nr:hypothetical protein F53441_5322 [Fusarium austroafricanum]
MYLLFAAAFFSSASALSYAGNQVPFRRDPDQIAANFPDVDQKLYSPAFLNPDHVAPGFANGTASPTSQQQLEQFLWTLASRNEWMTYHNPVFTSEEGRSIPYVVLSSSKSLLLPSPVGNTTNKVRVWFQGGVHGNEPAGTEALLSLLGKMDAEPEWALSLLEKLDIMVLPRYNPDGAAYFQRYLAKSFDPNRDHIKMASQQTMDVKQLNLKFNAHLHLDCHEYGAGRELVHDNKTYVPMQDNQFSAFKNPNVHADIRSMAESLFVPEVASALRKKNLTTNGYIVASQENDTIKLQDFVTDARGEVTVFLGQGLAFLSETRGIGIGDQSFQRRTTAGLTAAETLLQVAADNADLVYETVEKARADFISNDQEIIVREQPRWTESTWPYMDTETGKVTDIPVLFGNNTPPENNLTRARPEAYIFSRAWSNAALRLRAAGVRVDELAVGFEGEVEAYNITSATLAPTKYEGIALTTVNTELKKKTIKFPAGAYWVSTRQQHAAQAFVRLEPEHPDGFATFNILPVDAGDEYQNSHSGQNLNDKQQICDTVDVDENVSNLLEEVSILSRVLNSISNTSVRVPQAVVVEIDPGNGLWDSISATLEDIKSTFNKLNQLMAELEKTSIFSRGFLRKPTKQIKFSLRSRDITVYKDRIKSYNTAMTSAFQMINICLLIHSNSSQDSVFQVLSGLKSQLRHVEFALHTSSLTGSGPSSGREEDDRINQNLRQFVQVAENFHSSASTIVREGPRSTVWGGSIMGDPLTEAQTSMIERWIPPPVNEEPRSPVDADSDSETEFARRIEELAIKNEADGDHAKAEQFYRGAIEHGESSSRPASDITAMRVRLAYACMRQKKWTEAEEVITPIAFERKTNDILVYHGMHALALAYMDDSKLEEAEKYCKRALWGKRKVLGKDHLSCWETLTLLVSICKARNKMMQAEVHRSFIPNYEIIAIDPEALTYLDRSVGRLGTSTNASDMESQPQQSSTPQQEYPPSQPYTPGHNRSVSGPAPSSSSFQYPQTFGSQYTSPSTPGGFQNMVQYPTQHRSTIEPSLNPPISREAIGHPDTRPATIQRHPGKGQYSQLQPEQSQTSTNPLYSHNNSVYEFALLDAFDPHWRDHLGEGLRARGWNDDLIKENQQAIIDFFKVQLPSARTASLTLSLPPPPPATTAWPLRSPGANINQAEDYQIAPPSSPYNMAPVPTPEPKIQIFVAIDFMKADCENTSVAYVVPTVLYYDEYQKLVGWGHDIANALGPTGYPKKGVSKVECLPLRLIPKGKESHHLPPLPPSMKAVDAAADFLYEVRCALRTGLQQCIGNKFEQNEQNIHWIVTIPENWASNINNTSRRVFEIARYKSTYRLALERAGYLRDGNDRRLSFVGEAEASIHQAILTNPLSPKDAFDAFIFVSCGKETVHISTYQLKQTSPPFFSRLTEATNEKLGSTQVRKNFGSIVRAKVRRMRLPDGTRTAAKAYSRCIADFERRIMPEFRHNGEEWAIDVGITMDFPEADISDGFMTYTNDEISECFQPVTDGIGNMLIDAISEVFRMDLTIQGIILAGEFCSSEYLVRKLKVRIPTTREKVIQPMEPTTQVVTGAVHLALSRPRSPHSFDEAPLLNPQRSRSPPNPPKPQVSWSSLPNKGQLAVILLARLAEPLSERSLASYLFYQLQWLSPDLDPSEIPKQMGYITATFAAAQCLTSMWWGRAADHPRLGRKRVLMIGLSGSAMSVLGMGFSTSLGAAFFFRFCAGALNGNVGVLRTMVSEIVPEKRHKTRAFLLLPMCFNVGVIIGPLLTGFLADPVHTLPGIFGPGSFLGGSKGVQWLQRFPYALPNLFCFSILTSAFFLVVLGLNETHPSLCHRPDPGRRLGRLLLRIILRRKSKSHLYDPISIEDSSEPLLSHHSGEEPTERPVKLHDKTRLPFRDVLTRNVCLNMLQRFLQSLHVSAFNSLLFSLLPTPKADPANFNLPFRFTGGLGLSSEKMGLINTTIGMVGIPLQLFVYPRLIGRLGVKASYSTFLPLSIVAFFLFPYLVLLPDNNAVIWTCLIIVLSLQVLSRTFVNPATMLLVNDSAPSPALLGTVHGLASSISSAARILGPTIGGAMLGWGLVHNLVGLPLWVLTILATANWIVLWWIDDVNMSD